MKNFITNKNDGVSSGDGHMASNRQGKPVDALALKRKAGATVPAPASRGIGALAVLDAKLKADRTPAVDRPIRESFEAFLREDAMVPVGEGRHGKFSFEGREALLAVVRDIARCDEAHARPAG